MNIIDIPKIYLYNEGGKPSGETEKGNRTKWTKAAEKSAAWAVMPGEGRPPAVGSPAMCLCRQLPAKAKIKKGQFVMRPYIMTLDTGTTNTRAILWDGQRRAVAQQKQAVGVRDTAIDGNNGRLKNAVKDCLEALLREACLTWEDVHCVIASGMITSNVGLVEVPHLVAPVGIDNLARGIVRVALPDVCPLPIWFIPGVKNSGGEITMENLETMDIMRGEEVESAAIIEQYEPGTPLLLVLPGSHTKFVSVDASGRITGCLTSIAGELLASITNDTILADAVGRRFVEADTYDREALLAGCRSAARVGLGRTCFSGRIMNQFITKDTAKVANFVLGAVLQSDMMAIRHSAALAVSPETTVVVAGKAPLQQAIVDILQADGTFADVRAYQPEGDMPLSALGAYAIARRGNIL